MSFILVLFLFLLLSSCMNGILLDTHYGKLKGSSLKSKDGFMSYSFKHVPFAAPPVGRLRFELPQKRNPWTGVRDATTYGPACMSNTSFTSSPQNWIDEDCLHVNVFTSEKCLKSGDCPVIFYIHGGAFVYDSAVMFDDGKIIDNFVSNDIVFVITAMRLGVFSQLTFPDDEIIVRNMPYYDLKASLEWVQDSIAEFGGKADDVTLLGHSGGAAAALCMSISKTFDPQARLFQKAISMSPGNLFSDYTDFQSITWNFARRAGCAGDMQNPSNNLIRNVVECLKSKEGMELLRIQRELEDEKGRGILGMSPLLEPLFHGDNYMDFLENTAANRKLLIGSNSVEFLDATADSTPVNLIASALDLLNYENPLWVAPLHIEDMKNKIGPYNLSADTQGMFNCIIQTLNTHVKAGGEGYLYQYRHPKHPIHTDDLFYIMGVHPFQMDENEQALSILYPKMFIDFVKTGKPGDVIKYHPDYMNYYNVNYNTVDGTKPHNSVGYEKVCIDYFQKTLKKYDADISMIRMASKVNIPWKRAVDVFPIVGVETEQQNKLNFSSMIENLLITLCLVSVGIVIGWCVRGRRSVRYALYHDVSEKSSLLH